MDETQETQKEEAAKNGKDSKSIVELALSRRKQYEDAMKDAKKKADDHNKFIVLGDQWTDVAKSARSGRIMLTNNHAPEAIDRIVGEIRMNPPRIRVRAVDSKSDPKMAEVINGLIRHVEEGSRAHRAYVQAIEQPITNTYPGFLRVNTNYVGEDTLEQDIFISAVANQFSVSIDPGMVRYDAPGNGGPKWAMIEEEIARVEFKERFPKAEAVAFDAAEGDEQQKWWMQDKVRIAEYYYAVPNVVKMLEVTSPLLGNQKLVVEEGTDRHKQILTLMANPETQITLKEIKKITRYTIKHCIISGSEVLEGPSDIPCRYIPIIPVEAKNFLVDGKKISRGVITHAMEAMRIENYAWSQAVEALALAPKGKWVGTSKMFQSNPKAWENANQSNDAVLAYDADQNAPQAKPEFVKPGGIDSGAVSILQLAVDTRKALQNVYDSSLGARSNETSGKAIGMRDAQMQAAHYAFIDNLAASMEYLGLILVDMFPKVYDTHRIFRIYGEDGRIKDEQLEVNKPTGEFVEDPITQEAVEKLENDLSIGRYDVIVDIGPSAKTQRMETAANITQLASSVPMVGQLGGDLILRSMDFQFADELADRLKAALQKQGITTDKVDDKLGAQINAAVEQVKQQSLQAFQQAEAKIQQDQQVIAQQQEQIAKATEAMNNKAAELELKARELAIKEQEVQVKAQSEIVKAQSEVEIARIESAAQMAMKPAQDQISEIATAVQQLANQVMVLVQAGSGKTEDERNLTVVVDNKGGVTRKVVNLRTPEGRQYQGEVMEMPEQAGCRCGMPGCMGECNS